MGRQPTYDHRMKRLAALAAPALLLTLAACGGSSDAASPSSSSSSSSAVADQSYGTVVDLKDAAAAAGMSCPSWSQTNVVKFGAESGTCSDDTVLVTYASDADKDEAVSTKKAMDKDLVEHSISTTPMLVGKNWTILTPDAATLQKNMGGVVVH